MSDVQPHSLDPPRLRRRRAQPGLAGASCATGSPCSALVIIVLLILASRRRALLIPFDDLHIDIRNRFAPPFAGAHVLGTDPLGRDLAGAPADGRPHLADRRLRGHG